eukprot:TRINITY_DN6842_c0_g1_i9.p3 TRINITY_DN6842_c0_g1~~TRINITY_DN6842_c0_g1_i9.p3  ORF type:complete len:119 (-),score=18.86 TRINITY_DN6842_c0_g1_i9:206-562(-)
MENRNCPVTIDSSTLSDNSEDLDLEDKGIGLVKTSRRTRNNRLTHKDSVDSDSLQEDAEDSQLVVRQLSIKSRGRYPEFSQERAKPVMCNTPSCYDHTSPFGNRMFSSPNFVYFLIDL